MPFETLEVETRGRGTVDVTRDIERFVAEAGVERGLCSIFVPHTSASILVCENADPTVRADLERWLARAVPDGDAIFRHDAEGPDDMPAHVRSILTTSDLTIPIRNGTLALGTWQGVYLWEHRHHAHRRRVLVTVQG